jgi:hypothetical protein
MSGIEASAWTSASAEAFVSTTSSETPCVSVWVIEMVQPMSEKNKGKMNNNFFIYPPLDLPHIFKK